jgi:hypothetical protein
MGTYEVSRYGVIAVAPLISKSRAGKVEECSAMPCTFAIQYVSSSEFACPDPQTLKTRLRQTASGYFALRHPRGPRRQFVQAPHLDKACCFRFINVSNLDVPEERGT